MLQGQLEGVRATNTAYAGELDVLRREAVLHAARRRTSARVANAAGGASAPGKKQRATKRAGRSSA
jgi:hypothetical protein